MNETSLRSEPGIRASDVRPRRILAIALALAALLAATPLASAQEQEEEPRLNEDGACITGDSGEDARLASGVMVIADAAPPQRSTGAVRVMWDALQDDRRTGPDVFYEVYRIRTEDLPDGGSMTNPVPLSDETFLGRTTDTMFRDITGTQDVTYAWAVVARGDVVDQDPEACPGQDIRVFDSRELGEEPDEPLAEVCELRAEALPDGVVRLTWSEAGGEYAVYRGLADDETEFPRGAREARVSGGELYTTDLVPGVTYRFLVTVWDDETERDVARCNFVEVTAIPFFGGHGITALAGLGALGSVLLMRRRLRG